VFTHPASSREMPEEQNFATPPEARPILAGGRGVRRDFQYTFWDFPVATICGRSDPLTRGCDLLTDSARPLMGARTPLYQLRTHTDTKSDQILDAILRRRRATSCRVSPGVVGEVSHLRLELYRNLESSSSKGSNCDFNNPILYLKCR
jgi:hypothetical protein